MMIVIGEPSLGEAVSSPPISEYPDPLPAKARKAGEAAIAVLKGELDAGEASRRYDVSLPTLMSWLRAMLAAGLERRLTSKQESRSWLAASASPQR
jgi:DNA-binding transcriptional ArsR family regulator